MARPSPRGLKLLSKRKIARTALRLADREGLDQVTMRKVASQLGAGTMSLYHWFPNREALLKGMLDLVLESVEVPPDVAEGWLDRVARILISFRRTVLRHPSILPILATRQPMSEAALRPMEAGLEALREAGFSPDEAAAAHGAVAAYAIGFLSLEIGGFFRPRAEDLEGLANLRLERFPRVVEAAPFLLGWDPEVEFRRGLHAVLEGLRPERRREEELTEKK